jgi:hypothetical protein
MKKKLRATATDNANSLAEAQRKNKGFRSPESGFKNQDSAFRRLAFP